MDVGFGKRSTAMQLRIQSYPINIGKAHTRTHTHTHKVTHIAHILCHSRLTLKCTGEFSAEAAFEQSD